MQRGAGGVLVVDDQPEVARAVALAAAADGEREELIAHVEERHAGLTLGLGEPEYRLVKRDRSLEVADLNRDGVDAYGRHRLVPQRRRPSQSRSGKRAQSGLEPGGIDPGLAGQ